MEKDKMEAGMVSWSMGSGVYSYPPVYALITDITPYHLSLHLSVPPLLLYTGRDSHNKPQIKEEKINAGALDLSFGDLRCRPPSKCAEKLGAVLIHGVLWCSSVCARVCVWALT
jgi:hypothetical protein